MTKLENLIRPGSERRLVSPDVAASGAAPGPIGPLEETAPMAAPAPEIPQPPGLWTALATSLVLDDVEVVDAPEDQLPPTTRAGGTLTASSWWALGLLRDKWTIM
jgi:hypothetical protein